MKKNILWAFILIFVYFIAVQYNDPDPYIWMPTYFIAGFMVYQKIKGRQDKLGYLVLGALYLMWAGNQFPPEWEGVMLDAMGMKTLNIELGRESLGLGICTIVMWICAFWD